MIKSKRIVVEEANEKTIQQVVKLVQQLEKSRRKLKGTRQIRRNVSSDVNTSISTTILFFIVIGSKNASYRSNKTSVHQCSG